MEPISDECTDQVIDEMLQADEDFVDKSRYDSCLAAQVAALEGKEVGDDASLWTSFLDRDMK